MNLSINKIYLCHLGRIYKRDLELLVDSFKILQKYYINTELLLIGDINDSIKIKCEGIHYYGLVDEGSYQKFCNACDFFVLPLKQSITNMARWPSKIGDYLSYSKPIVSTKVSDFAEIFEKNEIGILAETDTVTGFSDALIQMVEQKDKWEIWGNNSYNYAINNLDWKIICNNLTSFYSFVKDSKSK